MIKLASMAFAVLVGIWVRMAFLPGDLTNSISMNVAVGCSMAWLAVFGSYFAWKLLLIMIRQLGAAMRGK
jgi:hypothetical protein